MSTAWHSFYLPYQLIRSGCFQTILPEDGRINTFTTSCMNPKDIHHIWHEPKRPPHSKQYALSSSLKSKLDLQHITAKKLHHMFSTENHMLAAVYHMLTVVDHMLTLVIPSAATPCIGQSPEIGSCGEV